MTYKSPWQYEIRETPLRIRRTWQWRLKHALATTFLAGFFMFAAWAVIERIISIATGK